MNNRIEQHVKKGRLRIREKDPAKIASLLHSAEVNAGVVLSMSLTEVTATVIFQRIYESIHQVADALWLEKGYEARDHDTSLEIFKEFYISGDELDYYKGIRNEATYRGYLVHKHQAEKIIVFWKDKIVNTLQQVKREKVV